MIALIIAPVFFAILTFLFIRNIKFFKKTRNRYRKFLTFACIIILFIMPLTIFAGFLLPDGDLKRIFTIIGNGYLGFIIYLFLGVLFADIVRFIIKLFLKAKYKDKLAKQITNIFVVLFTVIMGVYGIFNAHNLKVKTYDVDTFKSSTVDDLNIVLISDLHLGYNLGEREMTNMVNKINQLHPDLVLLAGDIFDNDFSAIESPDVVASVLNGINSKYGNFAVYGNHDIDEKIFCGFTFKNGEKKKEASASENMNEFVKSAGFTLLYDEYIKINDEKGHTVCYVYGRPDYAKPNFGNTSRIDAKDITNNIDNSKYIICLEHEPTDLNELSKAGVDLDLNGHTHKGQIWPGTLTIDFFWENSYGLLKVNDMIDIVTSGVGLFGPNMRVGSNAEIANIYVHFLAN